ncbi:MULTISPECIES: sulfotransferase [unclassified Vibrio]|uniref:Sulfotransferase n=1 Tax=Vibrio sp. HB236076 TaxID=3232307 RepID=A0AB39HBQ0_9VIBR|nr:sulfotransferase [Vibrio sp. HB161653]MDP5255397.1 sulfotransferase [Vibrio sp. HB161653]
MDLFLTGMMRSGTTLLQKSLDQHPELNVSYQNKTSLFLNEVKSFHENLGINKYHLLSHYSPNEHYNLENITKWLNKNNFLDSLKTSDFDKKNGLKEVLAEEFLPYLTEKNIKCINIIRDPRDVLSSMSFGNGFEHTGLERPILFDLKNWRKSVLISQYLKDNKNLLTIKMEDLLLDPKDSLEKIYSFLDIEKLPFEILIKKLNEQEWKSNSSFGQKKAFDSSVIGNYKKVLPIKVREYVEAICFKEMEAMEYKTSKLDSKEKIILEFTEPFEIKRKEFKSNYTSSKENIQYELNRSTLPLDKTINRELLGL